LSIEPTKNATPRQIAIYATAIIMAIFSLCLVVLRTANIILIDWLAILGITCICGIICYSIILFSVQHYIYRKVKLIYKNIHRIKVASKEKSKEQEINLDSDVIREVEQEVSKWVYSQRKEIESLKSLEIYRRSFMGDISHELKTPIFSIQGYIHTLLDGGIHDPKVNLRFLQRAAKNVERLQTIVADLEAISRLESGELVLEMQEFDIRTLILEVFADSEIVAEEQDIKLILKDGADTSFKVRADRESIRKVFSNLILNSIKYGNKGGMTKVGFYDMDKYILIEVADNGIGMSEKHLTHIFDRFYRVDKSRSREMGGSGLGLSIVKHIIEAHNQTINVRSAQGVGSTFGITLSKVRN